MSLWHFSHLCTHLGMLPLPVAVANEALQGSRIPEDKKVISSWWWGASLHSPIESPGKWRLSEKWTVCSRHQQKPVGASAMWYHHVSSTIPWYLDSINSIQLDESKWIQSLSKKSLKVCDSGGFSSLAIARAQLQTPTVAWQRSSILLCDLVLATWTSGWLQWIQNADVELRRDVKWIDLLFFSTCILCSTKKMRLLNGLRKGRLKFVTSFCHIDDLGLRKDSMTTRFAVLHLHCDPFVLYFFGLDGRNSCTKWRLATQLQPHGSSKSSSMVWFTQVVDVVVIVVDLTQHATSAWSSGNLKVWHFWISIGQKIGKTWNHRNLNVMKLYEMKVQLDAKCWKHFQILFCSTWFF